MLIHPDKSGLNVNGENTHFLSSLFLESLLSPALPEGWQFYSLLAGRAKGSQTQREPIGMGIAAFAPRGPASCTLRRASHARRHDAYVENIATRSTVPGL